MNVIKTETSYCDDIVSWDFDVVASLVTGEREAVWAGSRSRQLQLVSAARCSHCQLLLVNAAVHLCVCFFHIVIHVEPGSVVEYRDIRNRPRSGSWLLCQHSFKCFGTVSNNTLPCLLGALSCFSLFVTLDHKTSLK